MSNNTARVNLFVAIDIDADTWVTNYGSTGNFQAVVSDIRNYMQDAINEFVNDYIQRTGNVGKASVVVT